MATKYEIKKFIERRKNEASEKIINEFTDKIEQAEKKFITKHGEKIGEIKADIEAATDNFDLLCSDAEKSGIRYRDKYYSSPRYCLDLAYGKMADGEIMNYFEIPTIEKLKQRREETADESKHEYDRLIAVTQSMSAKDGITFLKNLGFDTSELEVEKEVTALTINIDRSKLYV